MYDFPKNTLWTLGKARIKGKNFYHFEIWEDDGNALTSIAYFRRSTAKAMKVAIKGLIKKMNKKK